MNKSEYILGGAGRIKDEELKAYLTTVDMIEAEAGLDFFSLLVLWWRISWKVHILAGFGNFPLLFVCLVSYCAVNE